MWKDRDRKKKWRIFGNIKSVLKGENYRKRGWIGQPESVSFGHSVV